MARCGTADAMLLMSCLVDKAACWPVERRVGGWRAGGEGGGEIFHSFVSFNVPAMGRGSEHYRVGPTIG